MSLYTLTAHYQQLLNKDELTREDLEALEQLPGLIEDKLIARAYLVRNMEYIIASINCEMANMLERRKRLERNMEVLQGSIIDTMVTNNMPPIDKSPHFRISIHKKKPRVEIFDEAALPSEYIIYEQKQTSRYDKLRMHVDIDAGIDIPGAKLVDPIRLEIK